MANGQLLFLALGSPTRLPSSYSREICVCSSVQTLFYKRVTKLVDNKCVCVRARACVCVCYVSVNLCIHVCVCVIVSAYLCVCLSVHVHACVHGMIQFAKTQSIFKIHVFASFCMHSLDSSWRNAQI